MFASGNNIWNQFIVGSVNVLTIVIPYGTHVSRKYVINMSIIPVVNLNHFHMENLATRLMMMNIVPRVTNSLPSWCYITVN